jgi:polysaccharide deacetylase 2 family uncharacterized protein YibQ
MALKCIDISLADVSSGHMQAEAFATGAARTNDVRVAFDNTSTRDDVLKCLRYAEHIIHSRARAENAAAANS